MLSPRPISREPAPAPRIIERQVDDGRLWELQERVIQIETDRRWLNTGLFVVLIGAGILGPGIGIWMSERRAERYQQETAVIEHRVSELDRDVGELLTAVLAMAEERAAESRVSVSPPPPPQERERGPAAPTGARGGSPAPHLTAQQLAEAFGGRVLHGPLDDRERTSLRRQWDTLDPALQDQTLTALLRRYGLDPEAFLAAIQN